MTVLAGTYQQVTAVGNAEDVSERISNIDPFDTPFQSLAGKGTADAYYTEWQTENLLAVNGANAVVEGDDAANTVVTPTVRVGNYLQTSEKTFGISNIQEAVRHYGRKSEIARQRVRFMRSLKRDIETILLSNQARVVGTASVAQKLRGLPGWIVTNASRGATGTGGTPTAAAGDGTQRPFSETLLKGVLVTAYVNGAKIDTVMSGPVNRVNLSSQLSGGATKYYQVSEKTLVATITVYQSDFGPLKFVPNKFQRERDMFLLDPDLVEVKYLEPIKKQDLAVTGLTKREQVWGTYTLGVLNEAGLGIIADLNTVII